MSTSVTLPEDKIEFIAKSDKEIRIEHRIASLEAEMHRACRIHDRRDDFIEMIDWTSMTIDDRETVHSHADRLNWSMIEIDHEIMLASEALYVEHMENPLNS
jgi:hypothetical protein